MRGLVSICPGSMPKSLPSTQGSVQMWSQEDSSPSLSLVLPVLLTPHCCHQWSTGSVQISSVFTWYLSCVPPSTFLHSYSPVMTPFLLGWGSFSDFPYFRWPWSLGHMLHVVMCHVRRKAPGISVWLLAAAPQHLDSACPLTGLPWTTADGQICCISDLELQPSESLPLSRCAGTRTRAFLTLCDCHVQKTQPHCTLGPSTTISPALEVAAKGRLEAGPVLAGQQLTTAFSV
jgi:hypothetical protein